LFQRRADVLRSGRRALQSALRVGSTWWDRCATPASLTERGRVKTWRRFFSPEQAVNVADVVNRGARRRRAEVKARNATDGLALTSARSCADSGKDVGVISWWVLLVGGCRQRSSPKFLSDRERGSLCSAAGHPFAECCHRAWWDPTTTGRAQAHPRLRVCWSHAEERTRVRSCRRLLTPPLSRQSGSLRL